MQSVDDLVVAVDVGRVFCVECGRFTPHQALLSESTASRRDPIDEHRVQCERCSMLGNNGLEESFSEMVGHGRDGGHQSVTADNRRSWRSRRATRVDA